MTDNVLYPASDSTHDLLFYDAVKHGIDLDVRLDFHIREADSAEIDAALSLYLERATAEFECPLDMKPLIQPEGMRWRHVSNLQKAIRRSDYAQALRSGRWLQLHVEDRLWKRLAVIAGEDLGLGSPYLAAMVLVAARSKRLRAKIGPKLLDYLLWELCRESCPKSRDLTDMFVYALTPTSPVRPYFLELQHKGLIEAVEAYVDPGSSLERRMGALWTFYPRYLITLGDDGPSYDGGRGKLARETLAQEARWPGLISYLFHWSTATSGYGLGVPTPLHWETLCASPWAGVRKDPYMADDGRQFETVNGMIGAHLDMHTQEGKRAISYFMKASKVMREHPLRGEKHFRPAVHEALFYAEVGLLRPRLDYAGAAEQFDAYRDAYFEHRAGLTPEDGQTLILDVREELPVLNAARRRILEL